MNEPALLTTRNNDLAPLHRGGREREVLRVAAVIMGPDKNKATEVARTEVLKWIQWRSIGPLPQSAWSFEDFQVFSGGRNIEGLRIKTDVSDVWGVRAEDPDKTVPGRIWTMEAVIGLNVNQRPRLSVRLLVNAAANDDLNIVPHVPGFIQQLVELQGLVCGSRDVNKDPWLIDTTGEAEDLFEMLIDPERKLPIFILASRKDVSSPYQSLVAAAPLAKATLGIAHVVILPASSAEAMIDNFGKPLSVFGGGVRAYLPGFSRDSNPRDHRLFLARDIVDERASLRCANWMRGVAATESLRRTLLGQDVLAFDNVRNVSFEYKKQRLGEGNANLGGQLVLEQQRNQALAAQLESEKALLNYAVEEQDKAEERAEAAEERARAAVFKTQQLLEQLKATGHADDRPVELPTSWAEFGNWCNVNLAGKVALSPRARRGIRSPDFADAQQAARCLLWLANTYRDRRMAGGEGSMSDAVVEEGVHNTLCGGDEFEMEWEGDRYLVDWHIKNGNAREPRWCLRIYYFWEPESQIVVIAEMPAHRRTDAT